MNLSEEREARDRFVVIVKQIDNTQLSPKDEEILADAVTAEIESSLLLSPSRKNVVEVINALTETVRAILLKQKGASGVAISEQPSNSLELADLLSADRNPGFEQAERLLRNMPIEILNQYLGKWVLVDPSGILCAESSKSAARSVADSKNLKDGAYTIRQIIPEFLHELSHVPH